MYIMKFEFYTGDELGVRWAGRRWVGRAMSWVCDELGGRWVGGSESAALSRRRWLVLDPFWEIKKL